MTINSERINSMRAARSLLLKLAHTKRKDLSVTEMRREIYSVLRHYPEEYWIDEVKRRFPDFHER